MKAATPLLKSSLTGWNCVRQTTGVSQVHAQSAALPCNDDKLFTLFGVSLLEFRELVEYDLVREVRQLHEEPSWTNGQNAKTLVKYDDFRIVLMAVQAGALVPLHKAPGCISIHMISGHVLVHALERTFNLLPGSLLALDKEVPHHLQAIDESALLLSIAWPGRQVTRTRKI